MLKSMLNVEVEIFAEDTKTCLVVDIWKKYTDHISKIMDPPAGQKFGK